MQAKYLYITRRITEILLYILKNVSIFSPLKILYINTEGNNILIRISFKKNDIKYNVLIK